MISEYTEVRWVDETKLRDPISERIEIVCKVNKKIIDLIVDDENSSKAGVSQANLEDYK